MKYIVATVLLVVSCIVVYYGVNKYQEYQFIESVSPYVKNTTLRLKSCIRYESDKSDGITYKELFRKIEESISETDKNILAVQTAATEKQKNTSKLLEDYLIGAQELQRALLSKYRKELSFSSSYERAKELTEELKTSSSYSFDLNKKLATEALEEMKKAAAEGGEASKDIVSAAKNLKEKSQGISAILPSEFIIEGSALDAVLTKNKVDVESTQK